MYVCESNEWGHWLHWMDVTAQSPTEARPGTLGGGTGWSEAVRRGGDCGTSVRNASLKAGWPPSPVTSSWGNAGLSLSEPPTF